MAKDLTVSQIERQNVLNNNLALPRIREALDVQAMRRTGGILCLPMLWLSWITWRNEAVD